MDSEDENSLPYQVLIEPEAHVEMAEAYDWYQSKQPGLGASFLSALNERLTAIEREPTSYPVIHRYGDRQVRRVLLRRFPYGIIYFIKGQVVIIISCFHASRDPKQWRGRLENSDDS
jgi:ParE toxin of type II toxin-antitoxin system, parDE